MLEKKVAQNWMRVCSTQNDDVSLLYFFKWTFLQWKEKFRHFYLWSMKIYCYFCDSIDKFQSFLFLFGECAHSAHKTKWISFELLWWNLFMQKKKIFANFVVVVANKQRIANFTLQPNNKLKINFCRNFRRRSQTFHKQPLLSNLFSIAFKFTTHLCRRQQQQQQRKKWWYSHNVCHIFPCAN